MEILPKVQLNTTTLSHDKNNKLDNIFKSQLLEIKFIVTCMNI